MHLAFTAAGVAIFILAVTALTRNISSAGQVLNPLRFLGCGVLLIVHFPLVSWLQDQASLQIGASEFAGTEMLVEWAPVIAVSALYLIMLPTARELYTAYLTDRYARGQGMLPGMLPGGRDRG